MKTPDAARPRKGIQGIGYIALSFLLWVIVEYITAWNSRLDEWVSLMPYVFIQYLVIILIFWYFIYRRRWRERSIFLLMLAVMYLGEVIWKNPLLFNPITFIPASILLASIWGFLTFIPLWLVQRTLRHRKLHVAGCLLWIPLGFLWAIILG